MCKLMEVLKRDNARMDIQLHKVLPMNGGDGHNSYANNSPLQNKVILRVKPNLQESIADLYSKNFPDCITMADMGCSSGPNTFLPIWQVIEALDETCRRLNRKPPILQVFLNDLPENDFNFIFKTLPSFHKKLEEEKGSNFGPCFIAAMPGNFYGRLFPPHSLYFVYSSYSLQWCSEGLIEESKLDSFNIPFYGPSAEELKNVIEAQGSFPSIDLKRSKSLIPNFHKKLEKEKGSKFGPCFIAAMPGSFYGRLFPPHFLHFAHSSYCLHWLSQVPEGLATESGIQLNKGTICLDKTSPPSVHKAYMNQFQRDFTTFLRLRSEEMISGGRMVLTSVAQSNNKPYCKYGIEIWRLMGLCLKDTVEEGLVQESALDSYNLPLYAPSAEEVRCLTEREGSFTISRLEQFELNWDIEDGNQEMACDKWERGKIVAARMRAVAEPMLASHFGDAIIDDLFLRLSIKVADCLEKGIGSCNNQVIKKKGILAAKPILEESIAELLQASELECLTVVDMGCSSGPNTLLPLWELIETIDSTCSRLNRKSPLLQVFLNDLPGNDFNTIFRSLIPNFHEKLEKEKGSKFGPCFIAAMPGSFYGRLFPPHFLRFAHSSYSLHWLSQGLVQESALDSCNLPLYAPSADEVRCSTEREGSFTISRLDQFELNWDVEDGNQELACDKWERGKIVAARMRAVAEPMLASHFGDAIIDDLFLRLSIKIADCLEKGIGSCNNQVISMIKK
ncbi:hypothetical protein GH714_022930 [Hevea brasiliensis]|uniref:Jasmonate O-methyltransferase n=1 Tax=Hevea brasiliensis TaxID=3981 RepID=A0A6A6KTY9_HEVBR|nr:hypothetical protein GH714_022930 [Hevea brasiliensis]